MRLQDVMSTDVKTVAPQVSAEVAWEIMTTHDIHHLVVVRDGGIVGVLSNRDAGGRAGAAVRRHCAAGDLMSEPAIVAAPSTTVRKAANLMRGRDRLPGRGRGRSPARDRHGVGPARPDWPRARAWRHAVAAAAVVTSRTPPEAPTGNRRLVNDLRVRRRTDMEAILRHRGRPPRPHVWPRPSAPVEVSNPAVRTPGEAAVPLVSYLASGNLLTLATVPVIYSLLAPFALLDLWITLYQTLCFPLYRVARVQRCDHLVIDRHRLPYLNALEKLNCVSCGYANGVLAYAREVAARTEQDRCPIQHERLPKAPYPRYRRFATFGDARGYRRGLIVLRARLEPPRRSNRAARRRGRGRDKKL